MVKIKLNIDFLKPIAVGLVKIVGTESKEFVDFIKDKRGKTQ